MHKSRLAKLEHKLKVAEEARQRKRREAVKKGAKISRLGWNGKEQWVELGKCFSYANTKGELINATHEDIMDRALVFVGTRGVQVGWLASQADMLAEDWLIGVDD